MSQRTDSYSEGTVEADRGTQRRSRTARWLAAITAILALSATLGASSAAAAPADGAGNYTQLLCADPLTGEGLGIAGMPEGLSNPASVDTWQITTSSVDCASGPMTATGGVPMSVGLAGGYPQGTWAALLYQAPPHVTINGGTIYRAERAEGEHNGFMGIDQQGGEPEVLYSLPRNNEDSGDWYAGNVAARGTFAEPFAGSNLVNLTISPEGSHWDVNATCDPNGNNDSSCTLAEGQWEYRIYGGEMSLHAEDEPVLSNISGPLTTEEPLHGTEAVTFSATDEGPGIAYVKLLDNGKAIESQDADTNGGRCIPIPGHDAYTWAYQVPCKTTLGEHTYQFDTTRLSEGIQHIQVIVEDAAGNQAIAVDRSVDVDNAATGSLGAEPGLGTGQSQGASGSASTDSGGSTSSSGAQSLTNVPDTNVLSPTVNEPASRKAVIRLGVHQRITRSFARRAVHKLTGRLLDGHGHPIAHAELAVMQRIDGRRALRTIGHVKTGAKGAFTAHLPPGPSRLIEIAYRASADEARYAAVGKVQETVRAGVRLYITPRSTTPAGTILLSGRVLGPVPKHGVQVNLLVHYHGRWEPFRTPETDGSGHFSVAYQFQDAYGRYPFMAVVANHQAGFSFTSGKSEVIDVTTN